MPEGDTIYRTALVLRRAILGRAIDRVDCSPECAGTLERAGSLSGRRVDAIEPRGKHLLMVFRDPQAPDDSIPTPHLLPLDLIVTDLILHTHMRMTGSWHIYRPGEAWQKPARLAVVTLYTDEFVVPCFSAPVVELLTARELSRSREFRMLGPDVITPDFNPAEAFRRMRSKPELQIADALLDQSIMAGVGNIYKSEILFTQRLSPFVRVRDLNDDVLRQIIAAAHSLLTANRSGGPRNTVFHLNRQALLWVYGRLEEPCRVCGQPIRVRRQGRDARVTYWCPNCQPDASPQVSVQPTPSPRPEDG